MFRKLENRDIEALSAITGQDYVSVRDEIHPDYTHDEMTHKAVLNPNWSSSRAARRKFHRFWPMPIKNICRLQPAARAPAYAGAACRSTAAS